jgi:hypothetical protein
MTADAALVLLSIVILDGGAALVIVAAAMGLGLWIVPLIGLRADPSPATADPRPALRARNNLPIRWQIILATGLGFGALALLVLGLGLCGLLHRPLWIGLPVTFIIAGAFRIVPLLTRRSSTVESPGYSAWLWLCAAPFCALALTAAACPPGWLWPAEGNGYDVLEYHFGAPKEYWAAGRIEYLPHNLYSHFPFSAEMLYLLTFVLYGSPYEAVYAAQMVNVWLGVLAAAGAWLAGREFGRFAGVLAGLAVATCPFVTYLCGVAYVENGLLAMTTLSLACLVRATVGAAHGPRLTVSGPRWAFVSGLFAGLACGFKYTALPLVALPMTIAWAVTSRARLRCVGLFILATGLTFAPWLVKNVIWTGHPVFPLARGMFSEKPGVWSDEGAARWHEGHLPSPEERAAFARARAGVSKTFGNPMFGPGLFALALVGGVTGRATRHRSAVMASALVGGLTLLAWAGATHLVDRFAVTIVAPLALLWAACGVEEAKRWQRVGVVLLVISASALNLHTTWRLFDEAHVFRVAAFGRTDLMLNGHWPGYAHVPVLNRLMDEGQRPLLVGEARAFYLHGRPDYCVVFNRNPFAEAVAARPDDWIAWLRDQGYSHVYVDWSEIRRLSRSRYGFWPSLRDLTPDDYLSAGLHPIESFQVGEFAYATLFRVPGMAAQGRGHATQR